MQGRSNLTYTRWHESICTLSNAALRARYWTPTARAVAVRSAVMLSSLKAGMRGLYPDLSRSSSHPGDLLLFVIADSVP
jgi:hypothetical protein